MPFPYIDLLKEMKRLIPPPSISWTFPGSSTPGTTPSFRGGGGQVLRRYRAPPSVSTLNDFNLVEIDSFANASNLQESFALLPVLFCKYIPSESQLKRASSASSARLAETPVPSNILIRRGRCNSALCVSSCCCQEDRTVIGCQLLLD